MRRWTYTACSAMVESKLDYEKGKDGYLVESWERGKKKRGDDDGGEEDVPADGAILPS